MSESYVWDGTLQDSGVSLVELSGALRSIAKHWVMQLEKAPTTGTHHYQLRVSLIKKTRLGPLVALCRGGPLAGCHWSRTSTASSRNFDYVMKLQTRVAGPWSDKDADTPEFDPWIYTAEFCGWQERLRQRITSPPSRRQVTVIVNKNGHAGKNTFIKMCVAKGLAQEIPGVMTSAEDLLQFAHSVPSAKCYILNLPRGLNRSKLQAFWTGVESLKDGVLYDKRHKGRIRYIRTPHVVVMSNWMPELGMLSGDRWDVWHVDSMFQGGGAMPPTPQTGGVNLRPTVNGSADSCVSEPPHEVVVPRKRLRTSTIAEETDDELVTIDSVRSRSSSVVVLDGLGNREEEPHMLDLGDIGRSPLDVEVDLDVLDNLVPKRPTHSVGIEGRQVEVSRCGIREEVRKRGRTSSTVPLPIEVHDHTPPPRNSWTHTRSGGCDLNRKRQR